MLEVRITGAAVGRGGQRVGRQFDQQERLLAETRQNLIARTEEVRAFDRKSVEATIARNNSEKRLAQIEASHEAREFSHGTHVLLSRPQHLTWHASCVQSVLSPR